MTEWRARIQIYEHDGDLTPWLYLRDDNNKCRGRVQVLVGRLSTTRTRWRAEKAAIDLADDMKIIIEAIDE